MVPGAILFVVVWILSTLVLSKCGWFRRRVSLTARLAPYVTGGDPTREIEDWLPSRAGS